jgi:DNA-binding PadR family transcriptional regulator
MLCFVRIPEYYHRMRRPSGLINAASPATFFVLLALAEGPSHGSDIILQVLSDSGARFAIGRSTIYDLLKELETEGLLRSRDPESRTGKRIYKLTAEGRQELREALKLYESSVRVGNARLI